MNSASGDRQDTKLCFLNCPCAYSQYWQVLYTVASEYLRQPFDLNHTFFIFCPIYPIIYKSIFVVQLNVFWQVYAFILLQMISSQVPGSAPRDPLIQTQSWPIPPLFGWLLLQFLKVSGTPSTQAGFPSLRMSDKLLWTLVTYNASKIINFGLSELCLT